MALPPIIEKINALSTDVSTAQSTADSAVSAASTAQSTADGKAPKAHASTATTYGIGTSGNYGHVKLSDSTSSTSAASAGIAASPKAVKAAYDLANTANTAAENAASNSVTGVSLSSKTLTVTKGDGTSETFTTVDTNTDTKVTQTVTTTDAEYPLLAAATASKTATSTETARFDSGVTLNPSTNTITATTFSGNATSATKLATARTIDGVSFNGTAAITHFGSCSTAAATAAKTVAITGFTLVTGAVAFVRFTVTNTAANPTLNINSTGAKSIYYRNAAISAGYLAANRVYCFVYDGSQYELVGDINTDSDTTYTAGTGLSLSSNKFSLANSGVTAGTYGLTAATSPGYGGTFRVPNVKVDATGRVTSAGHFNVTLPAAQSAAVPVGTVVAFAANSEPEGYLLCNGATVSRTTYAALFAAIGTLYGTGNGSTTFNLPNLTDRFIQGSGTAGTAKAAGLPNIIGSTVITAEKTDNDFDSGALWSDTAVQLSSNISSVWSSTYANELFFNASKSNNIYGASTTVQPPALTMRYYIKY